MRAAVYSGSRNLYPHMVTAAKSLVANSSVEKIYFLIEDDVFPEALPPLIETINISGQRWFPAGGPNMTSQFTYMALCRACYGKLLPEDLDKVLQLDVDTIVVDNIDELWEIDMGSKWCIACEEKNNNYWKPYGLEYFNVGVCMFNLKEIRRTDLQDEIIKWLNTEQTRFVEQDAWNRFGAPRKFIRMNNRFNECYCNGFTDNPAIVHYAGFRNWWDDPKCYRMEYARKYREMSWEEALNGGEPPKEPEKAAPKKRTTSRKKKARTDGTDTDCSPDV